MGVVAATAFLVFTVGIVGTVAIQQRSTNSTVEAAPAPAGAPAVPPGGDNGGVPAGPHAADGAGDGAAGGAGDGAAGGADGGAGGGAAGGAGGGAAPPVDNPVPPGDGPVGAPPDGGAGVPAAPPGGTTGQPGPVVTVQLVSDSSTKVVVRWTVRPSGTYAFTVIVTQPDADARTTTVGSATQTTIAVTPERPYCVRVTAATPGGARSSSKPLALRDARCSD